MEGCGGLWRVAEGREGGDGGGCGGVWRVVEGCGRVVEGEREGVMEGYGGLWRWNEGFGEFWCTLILAHELGIVDTSSLAAAACAVDSCEM